MNNERGLDRLAAVTGGQFLDLLGVLGGVQRTERAQRDGGRLFGRLGSTLDRRNHGVQQRPTQKRGYAEAERESGSDEEQGVHCRCDSASKCRRFSILAMGNAPNQCRKPPLENGTVADYR